MFKRKLISLDFHNPNNFNHNDVSEFRNLIVWLEDQKIRHYKIEDRTGLRDSASDKWPDALKKFLEDLGCPIPPNETTSVIDWLLGYAVRLEYGDNVDKYKNAAPPSAAGGTAKKSSNPLDNLNFTDPDFKAGVMSLASMLQIPPHPDHIVQLQAICLFIKERLSKERLQKLEKEGIKPSSSMSMDTVDLGFETPDYITTEAAKILRILHLRELRELQNGANEAVVTVQKLTANPKTDTKLGKVGRT